MSNTNNTGFKGFRTGLFFLGCLLIFSACRQAKKYHDTTSVPVVERQGALADIISFQQGLNASFKDPEISPLPDRFRMRFEGLEFFEPDTSYRVWARLERTPDALPFQMQTSTDEQAAERVYGILSFTLKGNPYRLEVYQSPDLVLEAGYEDYLFLPFSDRTNGQGTYEGGRYIDLRIPKRDSILLDFNKAYNPYCAYNPKYSCPLVPEINRLDVEIPVGVKAFKK
ncbi:DUF1684 domain-containing protein [Robiginitalea sp.]|jgi:hypothetical protein|uniref:DUF1684 domain-containing protein n=1 Tax=Robiginitalea sp. TaxID=1902411 RepID=UPI003C740BCB